MLIIYKVLKCILNHDNLGLNKPKKLHKYKQYNNFDNKNIFCVSPKTNKTTI